MADDEIKEESPPSQGELVLRELKEMNRMLGAINQNISSYLKVVTQDVELIKVNIAKIAKQGPVEVNVTEKTSPGGGEMTPVAPPSEGGGPFPSA